MYCELPARTGSATNNTMDRTPWLQHDEHKGHITTQLWCQQIRTSIKTCPSAQRWFLCSVFSIQTAVHIGHLVPSSVAFIKFADFFWSDLCDSCSNVSHLFHVLCAMIMWSWWSCCRGKHCLPTTGRTKRHFQRYSKSEIFKLLHWAVLVKICIIFNRFPVNFDQF